MGGRLMRIGVAEAAVTGGRSLETLAGARRYHRVAQGLGWVVPGEEREEEEEKEEEETEEELGFLWACLTGGFHCMACPWCRG